LSAAQHFGGDGILGPATNLLEKLNPVVNVVETQLVRWMRGMEKTTG
jgi:protein farnesyltransferase subunit beta|tara:strand:+ start:452 stop:592 length:141 start_codon:yes stop_codon:yes gene_type:complete